MDTKKIESEFDLYGFPLDQLKSESKWHADRKI